MTTQAIKKAILANSCLLFASIITIKNEEWMENVWAINAMIIANTEWFICYKTNTS